MKLHLLIGGAAVVALASFGPHGASALTLQNLTLPGGGPQFVDPDEKLPLARGQDDADRDPSYRSNGSGFGFSFSGRSGDGVRSYPLIPGFTQPGVHGPAIDPQTHDPYPR